MTRSSVRPAAQALLLLGLLLAAPSAAAGSRQVDFVFDGDTFVLADGEHVRLIGINAPELGKDDRPDEPLAHEARVRLQQLVQGKTVVLVPGAEAYDRYGRLLAYAWLADGRNVEDILLRAGLAVVVAIPPNLERLPEHQAAEQAAQAARRGIWAEPYYEPAAADRLRTENTGFRFVSGTVDRVWGSAEYIHLVMTGKFRILIPRTDLGYFPRDPRTLRGRQVIVRGWIVRYDNALQVRVRHPAMLGLAN